MPRRKRNLKVIVSSFVFNYEVMFQSSHSHNRNENSGRTGCAAGACVSSSGLRSDRQARTSSTSEMIDVSLNRSLSNELPLIEPSSVVPVGDGDWIAAPP